MAYLGNSSLSLSQLPSATIPFTGSQFAVNLVPNTVSALDLGSVSNPWRNIYGNVVGSTANISGGLANKIPYQSGANTTTFIAAPTVSDTYLKWNSSTGFSWSTVTGGVTGTATANQTSVGSIYEMNSTATYSVVIGSSARASYNSYNTVVIGHNARTGVNSCFDSVLIGKDAYTIGVSSVSIGSGSQGSGNYTTVIGAGANGGYSTGGVALGYGSRVADGYDYGLAIGYGTYSTGGSSIAIGQGTNANSSNSLAIGANSWTGGSRSIVIGASSNDNYYANTIVLNASNGTLQPSAAGFYVKPITSGTGTNVLYYDSNTGLITYGQSSGGGGSLTVSYNGSPLTAAATSIDFTGAGLTATSNGGAITVNVAASASGGSSAPVTTKLSPTSVMDMGGSGFDTSFADSASATYFQQIAQSISNSGFQTYFSVATSSSTVGWMNSNMYSYQQVGPTTIRTNSAQYNGYQFQPMGNPSGGSVVVQADQYTAGISMISVNGNTITISFQSTQPASLFGQMFSTNLPYSIVFNYQGPSGWSSYTVAPGAITAVSVSGMSMTITCSSAPTQMGGGASPMMYCVFTLGLTTSGSGGASSPATVLKTGMFVQFMDGGGNVAGGGRLTVGSSYGGTQTFSQFYFTPEPMLPQFGYTSVYSIAIWTSKASSGTSGIPQGAPAINLNYYAGDTGMQSWWVDTNMARAGFSLSSSGEQKFNQAGLTGMTPLPYSITQAL